MQNLHSLYCGNQAVLSIVELACGIYITEEIILELHLHLDKVELVSSAGGS